MFKEGMYGGCFDPFHLGHLNDIIKAAGLCERLNIIISYSTERDNIPLKERYRWIYNSVKHIGNIRIFCLEDTAKTKKEYNDDYWKKGAQQIKYLVGEPIDVVFCGDDYKGTNKFENLYKESKIYYFNRTEIPVSSTMIRENPYKYWKYIPNICKSYYTKKVLLIGGESTGKSVLTQNLALNYNTNFVSEFGRDTCIYAGGEEFMTSTDMLENLLKQKVNVLEASKYSNKILFVDTDALITKFYSKLLLKENSKELENCCKLADAINEFNEWDLILFLEPTVKFVQDGTRNETIASNREKYSNQIKELFKEKKLNIHCIDGNYTERFEKSKKLVDNLFYK